MTTYTYDADRLLTETVRDKNGVLVSSGIAEYDLAGEDTRDADGVGTMTRTYNGNGQVLTETVTDDTGHNSVARLHL